MAILLLILGFILFQLLIILHEYGHFLVAKRNGVDVEEFGLGFPPKMIGKTMGKGIFKSHYTLNWLPLGGFVRLKGESDDAKGEGSYGGTSLWVKTKIILAGVAVNYLIALLLFTFLAFIGIPRLLPASPATQYTVTTSVLEDSPASRAGLEVDDQIVSVQGEPIDTDQALSSATNEFAGQEVRILLVRDGGPVLLNATLDAQGGNPLGVEVENIKDTPFSAVKQFTVDSDTEVIESKAIASYIGPNSPAVNAGLKQGDHIVSIQGIPIDTNQTLGDATKQFIGQQVDVQIVRDGRALTLMTTLNTQEIIDSSRVAYEDCLVSDAETCEPPQGYLGVAATDFILQRSTWSAPIVGLGLSAQYTKVTLQGLWQAVSSLFQGDTETASNSVAGPVGVFFVLKEGATLGFRFMLMIIAIISLTLAIMNVLPIPALDGGRLFLTIFFRKILRKPLLKETEEKIVGGSMIALLALMALITVVDVNRFILN